MKWILVVLLFGGITFLDTPNVMNDLSSNIVGGVSDCNASNYDPNGLGNCTGTGTNCGWTPRPSVSETQGVKNNAHYTYTSYCKPRGCDPAGAWQRTIDPETDQPIQCNEVFPVPVS